jgi:hypothetical protein
MITHLGFAMLARHLHNASMIFAVLVWWIERLKVEPHWRTLPTLAWLSGWDHLAPQALDQAVALLCWANIARAFHNFAIGSRLIRHSLRT